MNKTSMNDYLDIAVSLNSKSLTLFVGTGFSKYLTNGVAPNWLELLVEATKAIDNKKHELRNQLFRLDDSEEVESCVFELTICAQILDVEFRHKKKNLKEEIVRIIKEKINIKTIDPTKLKQLQEFFSKHTNINIVTTNYDTLFSDFIVPFNSRVFIEGSTIPRINTGHNIYHVHGCINKPSSIILTLNDYYKFQNQNNYFSRKFYTLLQESTVAVLGYSLADFNLNTILSEVKNTKKESFRKSDIYYITRNDISDLVSKFYYSSYGIKTIEYTTIENFFNSIEAEYETAKNLIESVDILQEVIDGKSLYSDSFLNLKTALSQIMLQASSIGLDSTDEPFLKTLIQILKRKKDFTDGFNAWDQYYHFADWLIELASTIIIKGTVIEKDFCELVEFSLRKSSKDSWKGYSWQAWREWHNRWREMKVENQTMLQELIDGTTWSRYNEVEEIYK